LFFDQPRIAAIVDSQVAAIQWIKDPVTPRIQHANEITILEQGSVSNERIR